jgi:hypothetical protein
VLGTEADRQKIQDILGRQITHFNGKNEHQATILEGGSLGVEVEIINVPVNDCSS